MIPLTIPSIEEDDLQAVREVLTSGFLVQGSQVESFEQLVSSYVGVKHAIAVCNCTAALHLSLLSLDIHPGDLVLVTAYSHVATANVIELCGAQPIFIDIQQDTFNMDPNCLSETLTRLMGGVANAKCVRAIIPVHIFGQMADMPAILSLANRYNIPVIEDAACALGASLNKRKAGTWGKLGCFSFHPRKTITTGEGGIIATDDSRLASRLRAFRNHGHNPKDTSNFIMPGFNYRLTEFQAALGKTQMHKLDRIIAKRRNLANSYYKLLAETTIQPPEVKQGYSPVFQSYVILLPEQCAERREHIIKVLADEGIETTIGTWHIPMTTYFRSRYGYRSGDFPISEKVYERTLTLPLFERMTLIMQEQVVKQLISAIEEE